jgi:hypothetical protein
MLYYVPFVLRPRMIIDSPSVLLEVVNEGSAHPTLTEKPSSNEFASSPTKYALISTKLSAAS